MGLYLKEPEIRVDAILIDTGCNYYSTVGELLPGAVHVASVRKTAPDLESRQASVELVAPSQPS